MTRPQCVLSYSNLGNSSIASKSAIQMPPNAQPDKVNKSLVMSGFYFDEIDELRGILDFYRERDATSDKGEVNRKWVFWSRQAEDVLQRKVPKTYHNGQSRLEAFWRTVIGDKDTSGPAKPEYYYNYLNLEESCLKLHVEPLKGTPWEREALTECEREFLKDREKDPRPSNSTFLDGWAFSNATGSACNDRRFAVTRRGYLAIVPLRTEPGDSVCLIFGADVPFVLWKVSTDGSRERYVRKQCYELVGKCFVRGIMDGKGLEIFKQAGSWRAVEDFIVL